MEEYQRKAGDYTGVPFIDIEGILISGFDKEGITSAIEKKKHTGVNY